MADEMPDGDRFRESNRHFRIMEYLFPGKPWSAAQGNRDQHHCQANSGDRGPSLKRI